MTHRFFLTAIVFFSIVFTAQAQWSAGISGGANLTFWKWQFTNTNYDIDYEPGLAWRAAMQLEYKFSPMLSVRAELANQAFSRRITDLTDENGVTIPDSWSSEYFNTFGGCLLAKVVPFKKEHGPYLLAGPGLAFITDARGKLSANLVEAYDLPRKQKIELNNLQINREQWLADVGIGYMISFKGANHLSAEFRYQIGLGKFSNSPFVDSNFKSALLSLGYLRDL